MSENQINLNEKIGGFVVHKGVGTLGMIVNVTDTDVLLDSAITEHCKVVKKDWVLRRIKDGMITIE